MIEVEITFNDIANDLKLWIARKGNFSTKHNVQDDTERPDVDFGVIVL